MNNQILDEAEKHKGPRVCPVCGFQFPFDEFVRRFVFSYGLSKWFCRECGTLIKCDFIKIQLLWFFGIMAFGILIGFLSYYFNLEILFLLFMIPSLGFVLLTLFYAKFEEVK